MPLKIDVCGQRFGRLIVLCESEPVSGRRRVNCRCDCGVERTFDPRTLRRGRAKSCGCLQKEKVAETARSMTTHGRSRTVEYDTWKKAFGRCYNPNDKKYPAYGGRGIRVSERWKSFDAFFSDMGERPVGTTLDRIDVNGDYEPSNCRWASCLEQARNRRKHRMVISNGREIPLSQACEEAGINYRSALYRLNRGKNWMPLPPPTTGDNRVPISNIKDKTDGN